MFEELGGHWTAVMASDALAGAPVPLTLDGVDLVFYRGKLEDGSMGVVALADRCPHRSVKLSLGEVKDGCLQCPFHGWRFQGGGDCVSVPMNPGLTHRKAVASFPTREIGGLIWMFCGEEAVGEPTVPEALLRPGIGLSVQVQAWACHWTRAMENMLDVPHLPFVHRATIGRDLARTLTDDTRLELDLSPSDRGFELRFGKAGDPPARIDWLRPNAMELHILDQGWRHVRIHVWALPTQPGHTRLIVVTTLKMGIFTPLIALMRMTDNRIINEDRAVVESSGPDPVPAPREELHVPSDRPTLYFRRWYREQRQQERGQHEQGQHDQNPQPRAKASPAA